MPSDRQLIDTYIAKNGVIRVETTPLIIPRSKKSRLLRERHERKRERYRKLIKQNFHRDDIALIMNVSFAQVRKMANNLGLINQLRGLGDGT